MKSHDDHELEPIPGLPSLPPAGETIVWQGRPSWRRLVRDNFGFPWLAGYFAFFAGLRGVVMGVEADSVVRGVIELLVVVPLAAVALGIIALIGVAHARATVYTITSHRVVMRIGIALPMTFNLPFRQLQAADVRVGTDGGGDLALTLAKGNRLAWPVLWPHVRPWRIAAASPMLCGLEGVADVADVLASAQRSWALSRRAARPELESVPAAHEGASHDDGAHEPLAVAS
jgi:hypothetical protein